MKTKTTKKEIVMTTETVTSASYALDDVRGQMDIDGVEQPKDELAEYCVDCGRFDHGCYRCKMD